MALQLLASKKPLREGEALLVQFKLGFKKVYASEVGCIAYVDQFNQAKTCHFRIVYGSQGPYARLVNTVHGWPIK